MALTIALKEKTLQTSAKTAPTRGARKAAIAVVRPDAWADHLDLKVGGKQFLTTGREYIIPVMRDNSLEVVIRKAAQMGYTVGMIIKALHAVTEKRLHGLYLMPNKNGAISFVQGRIDPIIDSNPKLAERFHRVQNFTHKQTNDGINFYIRGTNVATDLREIPVDFEIWDERDKFTEKHLTEALARMDGSEIRRLIQLSTPTAPGHGVDSDDNWGSSDQREWEIPCPHCSRFQVLTFEENCKLGDNALDSLVECVFCKKRITDKQRRFANAEGRWVPQHLDGVKVGYHISQLNSPTKKFVDFIGGWFDGQTSVGALRGFHNNGLGIPFASAGDKFTPELMDRNIIKGLKLRTMPTGPIYVGVDVGNALHVKASYIGRGGKRIFWDWKILTGGKKAWLDLDKFLASLHNFNCVIDANPEKTKARELSEKYPGKVWIGWERDRPNQAELCVFSPERVKRGEHGEVIIDRTMAFDQLITDYQSQLYGLPYDVQEIGEPLPKKDYNGFYSHHMEMVRVIHEDEEANKPAVVRWEKTRNPDHWHHAEMFELIAMQKKPPMSVPPSVAKAFNDAGALI